MKDITVFTRTTCAPCQALKKWLSYKGLAYSEVNVDENTEAHAKALAETGVNYSIVPLTVVTKTDGSKQAIAGYNLSALSALV